MIGEYVKKWMVKANNDLKVAENEIKIKKFVLRKLGVEDKGVKAKNGN